MKSDLDEELIVKVQNGDIAAYEVIVQRYQQRLFRFILRFVFNEQDAEDIVQETLVKIYMHIDRLDPQQKFYSYVFAAAKNTAISFLRARKKTVSLTDVDIAQDDEFLYQELHNKEEQERISRVLAALDPKYRSILTLYYFQELSYEEISQQLKLPLNTVRTRLRRAKDAVRKILEYETD